MRDWSGFASTFRARIEEPILVFEFLGYPARIRLVCGEQLGPIRLQPRNLRGEGVAFFFQPRRVEMNFPPFLQCSPCFVPLLPRFVPFSGHFRETLLQFGVLLDELVSYY